MAVANNTQAKAAAHNRGTQNTGTQNTGTQNTGPQNTATQSTSPRQALGRWGERRAAEHVTALGWQIVDRNWRCPAGELDIVAQQPDRTIVFIEVKARSGRGFGDPLEAITEAKLAKLRELALWWLRERQFSPRRLRIDAIGVLRDHTGVEVAHVKGIGR